MAAYSATETEVLMLEVKVEVKMLFSEKFTEFYLVLYLLYTYI